MKRGWFEIVQSDDGWHVRFRAGNGQTVFTTETYTRQRACHRAIRSLYAALADNPIGLDLRQVDERATGTPQSPPPDTQTPGTSQADHPAT